MPRFDSVDLIRISLFITPDLKEVFTKILIMLIFHMRNTRPSNSFLKTPTSHKYQKNSQGDFLLHHMQVGS